MTCKDCIHYDVCDGYRTFDVEIENKECPDFKDKFLFTELPCKVGDTVYYFCELFGNIFPYFIEQIIIDYDSPNEYYFTFCANYNTGKELIDSIDFDLEDVGKTVFLTREEAEKALKECEHDNN